jgi:hypothetical protein
VNAADRGALEEHECCAPSPRHRPETVTDNNTHPLHLRERLMPSRDNLGAALDSVTKTHHRPLSSPILETNVLNLTTQILDSDVVRTVADSHRVLMIFEPSMSQAAAAT